MRSFSIPVFRLADSSPHGRWKLWVLAAVMAFAAAAGTWGSGQYRIGRLDTLKDRYENPVEDFAAVAAKARPDPMESDLLEGCKQIQIGTWLQTTDALKFHDPVSGNRVRVELSPDEAFVDLSGREISTCVSDEIENRQFDIGSMTNTWAIILLMISFSLGAWSWVTFRGARASVHRNIYAETLADPAQIVPRDGSAPNKES